jgi:CheY-like chemotaxis protein
MGGKLTVLSKVGAGSEFVVALPAAIPDGTTPEIAASPDGEPLDESFAHRHPLRILLVEDDRVNLKLMCMMLRKLGYEPLIAQDGEEAVEVFRREHPDCVLMDLQMPRKDGLQATREIRETENAIPEEERAFIAALTANIVAEDRRQCFEVGMDEYMNKPIKCEVLAKALERASATRSAARPAAGQISPPRARGARSRR